MQNKRCCLIAVVIFSMSLFCTSVIAQDSSPPNNQPTSSNLTSSELDEDWDDDETETVDVPISQIRKFIETFQLVKNNYVGAVTDDGLFENAIHGLVEGLDVYSRYLNAEQYKQLLEFTEGQIAQPNFRLYLDKIQQVWRVEGLTTSAEAYRLGLRNEVVVEKINTVKLQDLDQKQVDQILVGSLGSLLKIDFKINQINKSIEVIRDKKIEYDIEPYLTDEQILVLKVKAFQKETTQQVYDILNLYQSQTGLKGILIDLRDNPGGLLSASVELADLFLEQGLIVSTKGRLEAPQRFQALPSDRPIPYPVAILQNRYSASAAEVFTAALKEQNRAIVIGERSYGKGAIQKLFPLEQGALQMTVAYYYTPKGHLIEGKGVEPDEFIPILKSHTDEEVLTQAVKLFHQMLLTQPKLFTKQ